MASKRQPPTTEAQTRRQTRPQPQPAHPAALYSLQQTLANPGAASPADLLAMQRAGGNRAVQRLLSSHSRPVVQAKLIVGPDDSYEQEADRVAAEVTRTEAPSPSPIQRQIGPDEDETVQTKPLAASITRMAQRAEAAPEEDPLARTKRDSTAGGFEIDGALEARLHAQKGSGQPLTDGVRDSMETRFGSDFSQVRVHTGGESVQLNRALSAQAFTHGADIFFGAAGYDPGTSGGRHLLAHELTHVVQQGAAGPKAGPVQRRIQRAGEDEDRQDMPLWMYPLQAGLDDPGKMYRYLAPGADDVGGGWKGSLRRGAQRFGAGAAAVGDAAVMVPLGAAGALATGAGMAAALPFYGINQGANKLWNRLTNRPDDPEPDPDRMTAGDRAKDLALGAGKGLLKTPALAAGLGLMGAASPLAALGWLAEKGIGRAKGDANYRMEGSPLARYAKLTGLGLASPFLALGAGLHKLGGLGQRAIEFMGESPLAMPEGKTGIAAKIALGVASPVLGLAAGVKGIIDLIRGKAGTQFARSPNFGSKTTDQQMDSVGAVGSGINAPSVIGGGLSTVITQGIAGLPGAHGPTERTIPESIRSSDAFLRNTTAAGDKFSMVSAGFGALGGAGTAFSGSVGMASGIKNIFGGSPTKDRGSFMQWMRRGWGRMAYGGGTALSGISTAGKSIGMIEGGVSGSTSAAASTLASIALPAQLAVSGADVLKGGYMGYKAFSRRSKLKEMLRGSEAEQQDPEAVQDGVDRVERLSDEEREFIQFAVEYQGKRARTAILNLISGTLGVVGAALALSGVGAVAGLPLMIAGGLVKAGSTFYGWLRDKTWGKKEAAAKKDREKRMAEYAANNLDSPLVQQVLKTIGMGSAMEENLKRADGDQKWKLINALFMRR